MQRILAAALALAIVTWAPSARAQEDFGRLKLGIGSNVRITVDGLTLEGPLTAISHEGLTVGEHELKPAAGLTIERDRGHTGLKGMAIGAAVGTALGLAAAHGQGWGAIGAYQGMFWGGIIGVSLDRYVPVYDTTAFRATASQLSMPVPPPNETAPIFAGLQAKTGDRVIVTQDGVTVNGTIGALSASRLVVGSHEFGAGTYLKIEKSTNHTADGAVVGFFVGVLLGSCRGCNDGQDPNPIASGIGGAVIGALIGQTVHGRTILYDGDTRAVAQTVRVAPIVEAHRKGVFLTLTR